MIRGVLDLLAKKWLNRELFKRYFNGGKGIIIEKGPDGDWEVDPVTAWDEASEAERRNER